MIKLIVAVDNNYGIGYKNELLFRISEDLKHFKKLTTGHFIVMGRKTYESLPKTLPNRINVVLTRDTGFALDDKSVMIENDIHKIVSHYMYTGQQTKDLWIIGGGEVYKQFLPYADEIHLTVIHKEAENVDTYFPIDEALESFEKVHSERAYSEKAECKLTFMTYKRIQK